MGFFSIVMRRGTTEACSSTSRFPKTEPQKRNVFFSFPKNCLALRIKWIYWLQFTNLFITIQFEITDDDVKRFCLGGIRWSSSCASLYTIKTVELVQFIAVWLTFYADIFYDRSKLSLAIYLRQTEWNWFASYTERRLFAKQDYPFNIESYTVMTTTSRRWYLWNSWYGIGSCHSIFLYDCFRLLAEFTQQTS